MCFVISTSTSAILQIVYVFICRVYSGYALDWHSCFIITNGIRAHLTWQDCQKQCLLTPLCTGIGYCRRIGICHVESLPIASDIVVNNSCPGCVVVYRKEMSKNEQLFNNAKLFIDCNTNIPEFIGCQIKGNMYHSGHKILVQCDMLIYDCRNSIFVCGTSGVWKLEKCVSQISKLCPEGFLLHKDRCFFVSKLSKTWEEAKEICKASGGHLANIDHADLQKHLNDNIKAAQTAESSTIVVDTPDQVKYQFLDDFGFNLTGQTGIVFELKAHNDGFISLSFDMANPLHFGTSAMDEIIIGGYGGTKSVSWSGGIVKFGPGHNIGEDQFMVWPRDDPHAVNHIAIFIAYGNTGVWKFPFECFMPGEFWIGAQRASDGNFRWFPSQSPLVYTNWDTATGQPDNDGNKQDCMFLNRYMQWMDGFCKEKRNYICEKLTS